MTIKRTYYEFTAFPVTYRYTAKGYAYGFLSTFKCDTLAEARREVKRLKKVYKATRSKLLSEYEGILQIERVDRTPVD